MERRGERVRFISAKEEGTSGSSSSSTSLSSSAVIPPSNRLSTLSTSKAWVDGLLIDIVSAHLPLNKSIHPYCTITLVHSSNCIEEEDEDEGDEYPDLMPSSPSSKPTSPTTKTKSRSKSKSNGILLHKSKECKSNDPVWTVKLHSLYILPSHHLHYNTTTHNSKSASLEFQIHHKDIILASTCIPISTLIHGTGERFEYELNVSSNILEDDLNNSLSRSSKRHGLKWVGSSSFDNVSTLLDDENETDGTKKPTLALRFRPATKSDQQFYTKYQPNLSIQPTTPPILTSPTSPFTSSPHKSNNKSLGKSLSQSLSRMNLLSVNTTIAQLEDTDCTDFTFKREGKKVDFSSYYFGKVTRIREGTDEVEHLIKPYPDPANPTTTKYLTMSEMNTYTYSPSQQWVQAKDCPNSLGRLYVEILKCHDLPNLDTGINDDYTDAFVAMAFEDNVVRTDVIHDALSPQWMPWTQRAFSFPIRHPSSLLCLGVFDYDSMSDHDPAGRVVIDMSNFKCRTVYLLEYALHKSPNDSEDTNGTITLRLRFEWDSEKAALLKSFTAPQKLMLNAPNNRAFKIVRYLCRGTVDMEQPTMDAVKIYANEFKSYIDGCFHFFDLLVDTILWRGRVIISIPYPRLLIRGDSFGKLKGTQYPRLRVSLWFPIRSMLLFQAATMAIEDPTLIPSILFYSLSWVLIAVMLHKKSFPSPWERCKSVDEILSTLIFGTRMSQIHIDAYEGHATSVAMRKLEKERAQRVKDSLMAFKGVMMKLKREYLATDPYAYLQATEVKKINFFASFLYYVHMMLQYLCQYTKMVRNLITWKCSNYTFVLWAFCVILGTLFLFIDITSFIMWYCRIAVWVWFSPIMKLVDIFFVQKFHATIDHLTKEIRKNDDDYMDSLFSSDTFKNMSKKVKIAQEDATKLKEMREYKFGKYMEAVPLLDSSRYPCIPLPGSTARPYHGEGKADVGYEYLSQEEVDIIRISGQKLEGNIIPS